MSLKQLPCLEIEVEVRGGDTKNNEPGPQRHDKIKKKKKAHTRDKNCKKVKKRKHIVDINRNRRTEHLINSYESTSDNVENTNPCVCGWVGG